MYIKKKQNSTLTKNAQSLRRNMTKEERLLWSGYLKKLPVTVNRQKVIGRYIVDFCCSAKKVIIELDGSQHYESEKQKTDCERDEFLRGLGYTVLRYSNYELLKNFNGVIADIGKYLE